MFFPLIKILSSLTAAATCVWAVSTTTGHRKLLAIAEELRLPDAVSLTLNHL
jgi:hypothetical protein